MFRRLVSIAVALGLTLAALPLEAGSTCPTPDRSCNEAMFTDGCCHGQPPAPATATAFAETWSTLSRFHAELISWPSETIAPDVPGVVGAAVDSRALTLSSPPPDRYLASVLLI